jgi:hypothetical protein
MRRTYEVCAAIVLPRRKLDYVRTDLRLIIPNITSPAPRRLREAGSGVALPSVFDRVLIVNVSAPKRTIFPLVWVAVIARDPPFNIAKLIDGNAKENGVTVGPVSHAASAAQLANISAPAVTSTPAVLENCEFPNVPVKVAEAITWPTGITKVKVPTLSGAPGYGPVGLNGPLNSGSVAVIVAAFKESAESARSRAQVRVLSVMVVSSRVQLCGASL